MDMKILLDLVANHTSNDHEALEYHPDWFRLGRNGKFTRRFAGWADVTELNYQNPELQDYMKKIIAHWVKEYDIDGYRCDVAGRVPLEFWDAVRYELERIKPDIFLLAEDDHPLEPYEAQICLSE